MSSWCVCVFPGCCCSNDGSKFLSCSYDRHVKLWDTETGACLGDYTNKKMAYCLKFYPVDNNIFLVGSGNNAVVQWDIRTGDIALEYQHHLGSVNTVTFVDDNRRIVSTAVRDAFAFPLKRFLRQDSLVVSHSCNRGVRSACLAVESFIGELNSVCVCSSMMWLMTSVPRCPFSLPAGRQEDVGLGFQHPRPHQVH